MKFINQIINSESKKECLNRHGWLLVY